MGVLSRLIQGLGRRRGLPDVDPPPDEGGDVPHIPPPPPTPTGRVPPPPPPTPSTRPLEGARPTAGTRKYGPQGGTPSTERIHNPSRPGR